MQLLPLAVSARANRSPIAFVKRAQSTQIQSLDLCRALTGQPASTQSRQHRRRTCVVLSAAVAGTTELAAAAATLAEGVTPDLTFKHPSGTY